MRVKVNSKLSESFKYERGVRQGCPTSPLLFDIYINDILDEIKWVTVEGLQNGISGLMFADDLKDLKIKLDSINSWMSYNAMEINPSKCGIMIIGDNINTNNSIMYNGEIIPYVNKYVYLGIELYKEHTVYTTEL